MEQEGGDRKWRDGGDQGGEREIKEMEVRKRRREKGEKYGDREKEEMEGEKHSERENVEMEGRNRGRRKKAEIDGEITGERIGRE
jgi:hypothetical protein